LREPDRVFEAFFTTKQNGMGMGLPISRAIVESYNGRLWPRQDNSLGTTFCFTLPVLDRCTAEPARGTHDPDENIYLLVKAHSPQIY
jgi:signal transduction histidine kinase